MINHKTSLLIKAINLLCLQVFYPGIFRLHNLVQLSDLTGGLLCFDKPINK